VGAVRETYGECWLEAVFERNERVEDRAEPIKPEPRKASHINNYFTGKRLFENVLNAVLSVVLMNTRRIAQEFVIS
jgi:hypothetical protein